MEVKRTNWSRIVALLMTLTIIVGLFVGMTFRTNADNSTAEINANTTWTYTDAGTDPAGDSSASGYDRTSWTRAGYDTTGWKTGTGSFGAKKGAAKTLGDGFTPKTLLTQYKEDGSDIEAYFFRTTVMISDPSVITKIVGSVNYDDSATVYVNGNKIAGYDDSSINANIQYGGSKAGSPKTGTISVTEDVQKYLVKGENIIAVEIHQSDAASSDIYFDMPSLTFSTDKESGSESGSGSDSDTSSDVKIGSISLSVGADETQRNFTWYSTKAGEGTLLIAKASDVKDNTMPESATRITVTGEAATNKSGYYSYQTTASGLAKSTKYAYQVVNGDTKSDINSFTTGSGDGFSFAFAGDPQIGASRNTTSDSEGWEKTLKLINNSTELNGVDFLLSAGDQVERGDNEDQYDAYLEHSTLQDLPVATNIGNHDSGSAAYDEHFNVPNESTKGSTAAGGDYYFVYNHVLFLALNSNNRSTADHQEFMKQAIAATADQDITWKVVTFHHSIYSVASHASEQDILERRTQLSAVFKDLDIDVVLMGHDHVYCRTYMMDGETPMTDASIYDDDNYSSITNPTGILYVTANSASGSKFYNIQNQEFAYSKVMNQEKVPNISRVDVSDSKFTITTYRTSDMSVVDTFTINRKVTHNVTVAESENGTASADVTEAYEGDTVKLTATPDDGYKFAGWTVVSGDVTIEDDSFTMPNGDVEVKAVFEAIDEEDADGTDDEDTDDTDVDDTEDEESSDAPSTGDTEDLYLALLGMAIACASLTGVAVYHRKRQ